MGVDVNLMVLTGQMSSCRPCSYSIIFLLNEQFQHYKGRETAGYL
jgi:hypothetical protein